MAEIEGKVVIITGASSGIGEATAMLLAERGARLVLGARGSDRLRAVAARIAAGGGDVATAPTDVRKRDEVSRLVDLATGRYGRLDVLVNNAGTMPISPLDDLKVEEWEEMIDVNVMGVLYGIAAALPVFRRQGFGHFVNIASTAAHLVVPSMAVYAGTKAAVRVISDGLRQEAGDSLRVTVISPGITRTNFAVTMTNASVRARLEARAHETGMPPEAVARAIAFAIEQPTDVDVSEIIVRPTPKG